jgi:ABC-2 type transport system permease protein
MKLFKLIENEVIKMIFKKRMFVVIGILLVLISTFAYGEYHTLERNKDRLSKRVGVAISDDWRKLAEQQIIDLRNRLDSPYMQEKDKASTRVRIEQVKYYLDNDINPLNSTNAKFAARFMSQSIFLLLPLLILAPYH